jgi:type IV pilus assembly protein PilA
VFLTTDANSRWGQRPTNRRRVRRGFSLVELLAVVAIIGILATLAILSYRKYLSSARTANAKAIVGSIRIAQESYRSETLNYLSCSSNLTDWYPGKPGDKQRHWVFPAGPGFNCWRQLNVRVDTPTSFGFAVMAGTAGTSPPAVKIQPPPAFPNPTAEPWFVVQAAGDSDNDQKLSLMVSSSFSGEIMIQNESE